MKTISFPSSFDKDLLFRVKALMLLRVIVITLFLGSVTIFHHKIGVTLHLGAVSVLTIITYSLTLLYAIILPRVKNLRRFCYLQITSDIFVETGVIYVTGGIESPLSFLYTLSIISTGIIHHRPGIYFIASIASIFYGTFIDLEYYNLIHPIYIYPKSDIANEGSYVLYITFVTICTFFLVALLTGFLVEKLRLTRKELIEKSGNLQKLRAFHENVVESMGSGLLTISMDKRITSFNNAATKITGFTFFEMKGKVFSEIFHFPELQEIHEITGSDFPNRFEDIFTRKDNKRIYLGMNISSLKNDEGNTKGYICVFQDMTKFKEMEERVVQAERLAAIGKVAAGIAHEIRNPLASMSGSIQVLKQKPWVEKESKDLMDIVVRETDRLNSIVTRFLSYAHPHPVKLSEYDINTLIQDTLSMLKNSPEYNQRIVASTRFKKNPLIIKIDSQQIQQVLWNLCLNSIQAMPDGGKLEVSTGLINNKNNMHAVIQVSDTGCGIRKEDKDSIFVPFYTTKKNGTGLGLASVYRIMENHKGTINVESKVSEGSSISLQIPLRT